MRNETDVKIAWSQESIGSFLDPYSWGSSEGMKSCREISLWIWNIKAEPGTSSMEHSPFEQFQSGGDAKMMVSSRWLFRSRSQPVNHQSEEWPAGKKLSTIAMPFEWITIKTLFHRRGRSWNRDTPYSSNLFDSITSPRDNLVGCHMRVLPRHQVQQPEFFTLDPNHQWSIKTTRNPPSPWFFPIKHTFKL